jgi:hypothetical protein
MIFNTNLLSDALHPPLTISMILRDFKAYNDFMGHPDFNNEIADERGITQQYLTFGMLLLVWLFL